MPDGDLCRLEDAAWRVLLGSDQERHLPGQHNQESHGNDVVADVVKNPLDKLGLAKRIDLKPGEKLLSSRRLHSDPDSGTFDLLAAEVDTPAGRQVRLGIVYHEDSKHWAAGPDQKRSRRIAELDEQIARIEDGEEDVDDDLYEQLLDERSDLGQDDSLNRTVVLDPAAVGQLRAQLEAGAEKGRAFEKEFNAFWDSDKGRELTKLIDELEASVAPIRRKPSVARTDDERKKLDAVRARQAELYRRYNAPDSDPTLLEGSVPGGAEGDLHYLVEGNDDGEGGWRISLGVKPPEADEDWHIGMDDDDVRLAGGDVKKLLKALDGLLPSTPADADRSTASHDKEFGVYDDHDGPDTPLLRHLKGLHDQSSHAGLKGKAKKAVGAVKDAVDGDGGIQAPKARKPRSPRGPNKPSTAEPSASFVDEDAPQDVKKAQAELQTEYNIWSEKYGDDPDRWPDEASQAYYQLKAGVDAAKKKAGMRRSRAHLGLCTRAFDFELDGPGDGRTLEGYAAVFNSPARIRDLQGDFDEVILHGAFTRSLQRRMPVLQFDHGKDPRIGGTPIGKIEKIGEDDSGLYVRARLFTHSDVDRVREAIAEKAVTGMSFRFGVPGGGDKWSQRSGDVDLREIREADTHELGPVVFPAYDTTSVSVRSILSNLDAAEMRELVHELAEYLGGAVDLSDFTGRPSTRGAGGGDRDLQPSSGGRSMSIESLRLDAGALKALGVL